MTLIQFWNEQTKTPLGVFTKYCAFMHPMFEIKLSRLAWLCIAGNIVLIRNSILLELNLQNLRFATF